MKSKCIGITLFVLVLLNSCVSSKKLTYLQYSDKLYDSEMSNINTRDAVTPSAYKIMPYDNLYIRVITPDPQWSAIFNVSGGTSGGLTEESAILTAYSVDDKGYIEIPYVGKVAVAGKTLSQIKSELDVIFKKYVTDASISVRLVNNFISIIGEVTRPGRYALTKDRVNVLEALAMAGDLTVYSNRMKIRLIRQSPYGPTVKEFSLRDRSIFTSEYYYVMPNDIIYAQPTHGRSFQTNASVYTMFLTTLTTVLVIITFFGIKAP
jgi:polysaccharide biosynthesis/export protein